ncbi:MAG: polysaccharide biosynthesis/export family protein [Kiritimatiellae bacterium]|nr:polysaccharide biosynthesis/export family protein [Kiritimatiellia bacterium]
MTALKEHTQSRVSQRGKYMAHVTLVFIVAITALTTGCTSVNKHQSVTRYRPDVPARERKPWIWADTLAASGLQAPLPTPSTDINATNTAVAADRHVKGSRPATEQRILHTGDAVIITLLTLTQSNDYQEDIDSDGEVKLIYLGNVQVSGKTTSEAETLIENLYIKNEIYTDINVSIRAQKVTYFIRGEVKAPQQYVLAPPKNLMQAIAEAGGYALYANEKKISIRRDNRLLWYNGKNISSGKDQAPLIQGGDIIVVEQKIF